MQIPVKVKATGEIVDVAISVATAGNPLYTTSGGVTYLGDDIESAEPDWQQVRIQFVGQIASAIISNYEFYAQGIAEECKKSGKSRPEMVAQMSIEIADALIAELKKGGGDDNNH